MYRPLDPAIVMPPLFTNSIIFSLTVGIYSIYATDGLSTAFLFSIAVIKACS